VPVGHDYAGAPDQLDRNLVLEKIKPILEDPTSREARPSTQVRAHVLANHGIELKALR